MGPSVVFTQDGKTDVPLGPMASKDDDSTHLIKLE